jgi:uncharacterized membrane protein YdjX (TVP38/TMEM64 family)
VSADAPRLPIFPFVPVSIAFGVTGVVLYQVTWGLSSFFVLGACSWRCSASASRRADALSGSPSP